MTLVQSVRLIVSFRLHYFSALSEHHSGKTLTQIVALCPGRHMELHQFWSDCDETWYLQKIGVSVSFFFFFSAT
jgi:hypothetical protein